MNNAHDNNPLKQLWDSMVSSPDSKLSVSSSETGNKMEIKKDSQQKFDNAVKGLWIGLTFSTVVVSGITIAEFTNRVDTIRDFAQSGKMDTHNRIVDTEFLVSHGANLKDSFTTALNKLGHAYTNSEDIDINFENNLMNKQFHFISKEDILNKIQLKDAKNESIPEMNKKISQKNGL